MTSKELHTRFTYSCGVCTDTRKLRPGELFFALKGPNFDGNQYAKDALDSGAGFVVVDDKSVVIKDDPRYLLVDDSLKALQDLANYHRQQLRTTIIGLTGSNGKTTTKELLRLVFECCKRVFVTPGNYNNHIGLPLSLLQLKPEHDLAILEMGDNQPGDIRELCEIAEPDHALITNIGFDHLGGYTDMDENAAGKLELFDYVRKHGGTLFFNRDDEYVHKYMQKHAHKNVVSYSLKQHAGYRLTLLDNTLDGMHFEVETPDAQIERFNTTLYGAYNLHNLLAAIVVGRRFGCSYGQIRAGISAYFPSNNRSQVIRLGRQTIIADAYNANPSSIHPAMENAMEMGVDRVGFILADMLELGKHSTAEHEAVGKKVKRLSPEACVFVGPEMKAAKKAARTAKYEWFPSTAEAARHISELMQDCELILLKGSRGARLESLIPAFGAYQILPA